MAAKRDKTNKNKRNATHAPDPDPDPGEYPGTPSPKAAGSLLDCTRLEYMGYLGASPLLTPPLAAAAAEDDDAKDKAEQEEDSPLAPPPVAPFLTAFPTTPLLP